MANVFNDDRVYFPEDSEMQLLGNREKLAQWRHRMCGPAFIRIGRRIAYHGADLNAWLASQRTDPNNEAA